MKNTIVCSAKNEAPYIIEWMAYHYLIGFNNVLVVTNDNTDCSLELYNRLKAIEGFDFIPHEVAPGDVPGVAAYRLAVEYLLRNQMFGYAAVCDPDEFLWLDKDINIGDFFGRYPDADVIGVNWRLFGSSGHLLRTNNIVVERFKHCAPVSAPIHVEFKSVFRVDKDLKSINPHYPTYGGEKSRKYVHANGEPMDERVTKEHPYTRHSKSSFGVAQFNHYLVKSREEFDLKMKRGRLSQSLEKTTGSQNRYTDDFFSKMDFNEVVDSRISNYAPAIRSAMEKIYLKCRLRDLFEPSFIGL